MTIGLRVPTANEQLIVIEPESRLGRAIRHQRALPECRCPSCEAKRELIYMRYVSAEIEKEPANG